MVARYHQSALDDTFGIQTTVLKARFQFLAVWRQHENANRVRNFPFKLQRSLNIYIKQEIMALRFGLIERTAGSPVRVAENVRVFKKFVGGDHAFKLIACDEEVFMAVPLASPRRTGCVGNREIKTRDEPQQQFNKARLARPGWTRNDEDYAHCRSDRLGGDFYRRM